MALYAIAFRHDLMGTEGLFGKHVGVAGEADLIRIRGEELPMGRGMGVVAARALPFLYRRMDRRLFELVLERHMTGQAILPLCPRFQPELIFLRRDRGHDSESAYR
jgi:hypothetical protein